MIVKTISHKSTKRVAIKKLIEYVFAPEKLQDKKQNREPLIVKRNIRGYDTEKWIDAFKSNDENRTFRHTNRTVLRHEMISFSPEDSHKITREVLKDFGKWYLKNRSESLGVCGIHYQKAVHMHFIISAVAVDGRSTRISRKQFKEFKIRLQEYQQEKYPELSHSIVNHSKKKSSS